MGGAKLPADQGRVGICRLPGQERPRHTPPLGAGVLRLLVLLVGLHPRTRHSSHRAASRRSARSGGGGGKRRGSRGGVSSAVVAGSSAAGEKLAGPVGYAVALLAGVVEGAPAATTASAA